MPHEFVIFFDVFFAVVKYRHVKISSQIDTYSIAYFELKHKEIKSELRDTVTKSSYAGASDLGADTLFLFEIIAFIVIFPTGIEIRLAFIYELFKFILNFFVVINGFL